MKKYFLLLLFIVLSLYLSSCSSQTVKIDNPQKTTMQEEAQFASEMESSENAGYFATDEAESSEDQAKSGESAPAYTGAPQDVPGYAPPTWPTYLWRRGRLTRQRSIAITEKNVSSATIKITNSVSGQLILLRRVLFGEAFSKSFTMTGDRYAYFTKYSTGVWRLNGLSALEFKSAGATIDITRVRVLSHPSGSVIADFSDPAAIINKDSIIKVTGNAWVKVEVTVNKSSSTAFVYAHTGFWRPILSDEASALWGDTTAGDGVFTRYFYIGGETAASAAATGVRRIVLDAITKDTLNSGTNTTTDWCMWFIPYVVQ